MKTKRSFIVVMLLFTFATFLWAAYTGLQVMFLVLLVVWGVGIWVLDFFDSTKKRATQGDAVAQNNLGSMYVEGKGVPQDYTEALKWYRLAAAQGYAEAQFNLGVMYLGGEGVPQDYAEALKWYRLAAAQGEAKAQFNLGL